MTHKMEIENELQKLNPQITEVEIGVRNLRTIKIYPLSIGDQLELTDLITEAMQRFFGVSAESTADTDFVIFILAIIKKNLGRVLELATCNEYNDILKDITNEQAIQIGNIIYNVNFKCLEKNMKGLSEKLKQTSQSERPLPGSASGTQATDLNTSSTETSRTAA